MNHDVYHPTQHTQALPSFNYPREFNFWASHTLPQQATISGGDFPYPVAPVPPSTSAFHGNHYPPQHGGSWFSDTYMRMSSQLRQAALPHEMANAALCYGGGGQATAKITPNYQTAIGASSTTATQQQQQDSSASLISVSSTSPELATISHAAANYSTTVQGYDGVAFVEQHNQQPQQEQRVPLDNDYLLTSKIIKRES